MKRLVLSAAIAPLLLTTEAFAGDREWLPPNPPAEAMQGECYARVRIAPEFDAYTETVTTRDAYEQYTALPASLRTEVREYIAREPGFRYIVHEPVYENVTETVLVREGYTEYVVQPAQHETVTETIMVREPQMVWRRGYVQGASMTRIDEETGEVWCLVEEEGEYRTVTRQVMVQPAHIQEIAHDPEYSSVTREVLVQEARVEEVPIDPLYDSYSIQVVDQAARLDRHTVDGQTENVTRYTMRSRERWEWRLVDCNDIDLPGYNPPSQGGHPAVAQSQPQAPVSQGNTYLYGTNQTVETETYSEELPVAQSSYRRSSRH